MSLITNCKNNQAETTSEIKLVTAEEMQTILDVEDAQLIDVRTPEEFEEGHILNAQNIDFSSPTFDEEVNKLDKSRPVILYCRSGGRSAKCAEKMKEAGFKKIYDLEGGISKWQHSDKIRIEAKS
ncbi:rhodanese-like domain-containing protein [Winogradskyella aurantia]|uniref:rhodanese-like domain-containing protein n=1 Tax=Winogradskyella aurantia TaxID=1915063 RepID=UPI001F0B6B3A|nr:rhodanese-like domain-containing protein [Winogradskyella aurantia]